MAVSQKGYDVKTCDDRFLVYSSAFQTLKVFSTFAGSTTKPSGAGVNTITITHNLGYLAPYIIVYNGSTTIGTGKSYFFCDSKQSSFTTLDRMYTDRLEFDINSTFDSGATSSGATVYFTVYIFLDDFRTVSPKSINSGLTSGASSQDYGIRVSKDGFDVKTCDDINCVSSSSFFTQIIHMKGTQTTASPFQVTHGLGYIPNHLLYVKRDWLGETYISYEEYLSTWSTSTTLDSGAFAGSVTYYYIVFKQQING